MGNLLRIETISQLHEIIGYQKPKHPLVSLIEMSQVKTMPVIRQQVAMGMYSISLKNGHECKIKYGRQSYDFQEGTLMFLAPDQTIEPVSPGTPGKPKGWILLFHPDLLRRCPLGKRMNEYSFFFYDSHEALHLSEQERQTVTTLVKAIKAEYSQNMDGHTQQLIISHLELLLNYCQRFYSRQFISRTNANKDVVVRFEALLNGYFNSEKLASEGLPSVKYCAREMGYSPNYLSDLLKKETGKNTQEHIQFHLIEKAKTLLLGTDEPVYRIAYALGFEYPQHFSKLFKHKTGTSPAKFRH